MDVADTSHGPEGMPLEQPRSCIVAPLVANRKALGGHYADIAPHLTLTLQPLLINEDRAGAKARLGFTTVPGSQIPTARCRRPTRARPWWRASVCVGSSACTTT
jgi:hypothetical protein